MAARPHLGELCAQEEDLRGVVDPQQHDRERARRAVGRAHRRPAEVQADRELPHREEQRGDRCPGHHLPPAQPHVGQVLEDEADEQRRQREVEDEAHQAEDSGQGARPRDHRAADAGQRRAHDQRHQQQEAHGEHKAEGERALPHKAPHAAAGPRPHLPHRVQRRLQLADQAGRAHHHRREAQHERQACFARPHRGFEHGADQGAPLLAEQSPDLDEDLLLHAGLAERQAGHRDHDHQQRGQREGRVVGKRGGQARDLVLAPGLFEKRFDGAQVHVLRLASGERTAGR